MALSLEQVQNKIVATLKTALSPDPVMEQGYPDIENVPKVNGRIKPYYSVRFGDIIQSGPRNFNGAFHDDYRLQFTVTSIAGTAIDARLMSNKVLLATLGKTFDWAGQVRKRWGGGMLSTSESNAATEAYAFPSAFDIVVQLHVDET